MGKSDPPPAPDYAGAAVAEGQAGKENLAQQTWANRPTQNTPWGSTSWSTGKSVDPATGIPVTTWEQNQTLDPKIQGALENQMNVQEGRTNLAQGQIERVGADLNAPFDWNNLPARPGSMEEAQQQAYGRIQDFQKPEREQATGELDQQLANQGITPGTPAYETAKRRMADANARADVQNLNASFGEGRAQGEFQGKTRAQAIAEQAQRRGMSINELNALMSGQQVSTPQMPGFTNSGTSAAPDLTGAANAQYGSALDATNANNAQVGQTWGTVGSIAAMAAMYY